MARYSQEIQDGCPSPSIWNDMGLKMDLPPEMRDLTRRLLACEADAGEVSEPMESVTLRVYEKLRQRLSALTGVAGFQSLASRALTLARPEAPDLIAVQIAADGSLQDTQIGIGRKQAGTGEVILIARLLGLLLIFLGEALTLSLMRDLWPDAASDNRISGNGRKA